MSKLFISGGNPLFGEISVSGAKNSALPILAASLLCSSQSILHNCPQLTDVNAACKILSHLGCDVLNENGSIIVSTDFLCNSFVPDSLSQAMRCSIVFLGAIIARLGKAKITYPGGCDLGSRPIDFHINAFKQMGIVVKEEFGYIECSTPNGIKGTTINLIFPSVGATENIMLAAVLAKGKTVINNAACEPEIVDLACYLNKCGAKIKGFGTHTIIIDGVTKLFGCEHNIIPDRIVCGTYLCSAAITNSNILVKNCSAYDLYGFIPFLENVGCTISSTPDTISIKGCSHPLGVGKITTAPYPGFPTDIQSIFMAVCSIAVGSTIFVENLFDSRYKHVCELKKMGANISVSERAAYVQGVSKLFGAKVSATDLRGGAALVVAALSADGVTEIDNIYHIDRGYEAIEKSLSSIGAQIVRK